MDENAPALPLWEGRGFLFWVNWVVSVLFGKGVVWGFARLEGVLPKIPILKKVRKVPEYPPGGQGGCGGGVTGTRCSRVSPLRLTAFGTSPARVGGYNVGI